MLDILEDNRFKIRAYRNAARNLSELGDDVETIAERSQLEEIPGIGKDLGLKIKEYIETNKITYYEELKKKAPEELVALLGIQGLGPKTLAKLFKELKVRNLDDLQKAIEGDEILELEGMGEKKVQDIKRGIQIFKESVKRTPLGIVLPIAETLISEIGKIPGTEGTVAAGSLRRMRETIGDIDILTKADDGQNVIKAFTELPFVKEVLASGGTKGSIIIKNGVQVDLRVVSPESYGAALHYFTGSKAHNVKLRTIALKKGFKINEYGIFRDQEKLAGETEKEIYSILGIDWIPPEIREDKGEIEASFEGRLPDLVELSDIKGDLHTHTKWSDGKSSIEEMALKAKELGYEYIAITDHSPSSRIAGGLSVEKLYEKKKEIEAVRKRLKGIKVLMGSEVDIKSDGSLDYPDEVLKDLDVVVASVHSGFKMDRETMTTRIVKALQNPFVHVLGHPTGRLIGERDPYDVDIDRVIRTAKEFGKSLEVNSFYSRLDLNNINVKKAVDIGVKIVISTDSHHADNLGMMRLGVATARRGWAEKKDVLNTLGYDELRKWLNSHSSR